VVGPSGQILRSAAQGDLDVVITHAPALEARILGAAHTALRCPLVASRFGVVARRTTRRASPRLEPRVTRSRASPGGAGRSSRAETRRAPT